MLTLRQTSAVQKWLNKKVLELKKNVDKNFRATGKTSDSIASVISGNRAQIIGSEILDYGEHGRRKTTKGPEKGLLKGLIRDWIDVKGIVPKDNISKDTLAYLIARKIHRDGIRVPNKYNAGKILSSVINDKSISELMDEYKAVLISEIESEILDIVNKAA